MPDKNKNRSMQEIQQEYQNACLKLGHLSYQVYTLNKDIDLLNSNLRDLNLEAASVKAVEDAEKAVSQAQSAAIVETNQSGAV